MGYKNPTRSKFRAVFSYIHISDYFMSASNEGPQSVLLLTIWSVFIDIRLALAEAISIVYMCTFENQMRQI